MALRGYLQIPDANKPLRILYTDDSFTCWIEFQRGDLLHHIPGGTDPWSPMGTVWIKREAPITKCQTGYALFVVHPELTDDDPAGGPRPPYSGPRPPYSGPRPPYS